jgi:hypothetical protein
MFIIGFTVARLREKLNLNFGLAVCAGAQRNERGRKSAFVSAPKQKQSARGHVAHPED